MNKIVVRGAREHNLKSIDVEIPRDKLVVITGLSGSGKSSLAFDTIYAEGQRRYVESLSAYARQFLEQNQKPDVDGIDGLSPAISIEQKSTSKNPRSTVGTLTEIYDYLRLLYARIGVPHCYKCGKPIESQTVQQIVDTILAMPDRTKFLVLAPVVRGRKGEYRKELLQFRKEGFVRVRIDGADHELGDDITLDKQKKHTIELVVDRLILKPDLKQRLTDSVELALRKAEGIVKIQVVDGEERTFSERFACDTCGVSYPELAPRLFSFNSPFGACEGCDGLGHSMEVDPAKVVPDESKSLSEGAVAPWFGRWSGYYLQQLASVAKHYKQSPDTPWSKLPKAVRKVILHGSGSDTIRFAYQRDGDSYKFSRPFEGVIPTLERRMRESQSDRGREEIEPFTTYRACSVCNGARLKPEALAVKVEGKSIYDACSLAVGDAQQFFLGLKLSQRDAQIAVRILKEVRERLSFLEAVGLDYLNLDRSSATLSGGEAQRIRLATQIGSALQGVVYVLDEPSIGLHQRDNERLLGTLKRLRDLGNTVLVVEHDEDTIRAADWVLDMGPGAGVQGGRVTAEGPPETIAKSDTSLTGEYLSGRRGVAVPTTRRPRRNESIWIKGATGNNLKGVDVEFPLGQLICVTGVSGSGKSTLVNDTLYRSLAHALHQMKDPPAPHKAVTGLEHIDKVIDIDQSPIGRTPRSNPATYTQVFGLMRDLFCQLPESRARGYKPGRYSFNVKGGRCEACEGDGIITIEMHFLPDVHVTCEQCKGKRYNRETLEILYKGKSIADVLDMTVDEGLAFLDAITPIKRKLETLQAVGLGYIKLGQSATTLSGGEAQRIKLSKELSRRATGRTIYILDEPTTGLHFYDVERLLHVLHALVDTGNTVVVIEHNLDVIKTADHVIDLGPEGGFRGGAIVGVGTPEHLASIAESHTGRFLEPLLADSAPPLGRTGRTRRASASRATP
jgi:excinuclease ABC subunit A